MSTALVLAADGRREGGRCKRGSRGEVADAHAEADRAVTDRLDAVEALHEHADAAHRFASRRSTSPARTRAMPMSG